MGISTTKPRRRHVHVELRIVNPGDSYVPETLGNVTLNIPLPASASAIADAVRTEITSLYARVEQFHGPLVAPEARPEPLLGAPADVPPVDELVDLAF